VLLSMTVFQLIVAENVPESSHAVPLIGMFHRYHVDLCAASLSTLTMSIGVGRIFESVCLSVCLFFCLFVRSITQKRMTPKCSNLVQGLTLGCPRRDAVLGFKGQRSRL